MKPRYIITLLIFFLSCHHQPVEVDLRTGLNLVLRSTSAPRVQSIFNPKSGMQKLGKSGNLVHDLVCMLHCDEDSGTTVYDQSGYENHGKLYNVDRIPSPNRYALNFNGTSAYALIDDQPELRGTHGISITCKIFAHEPLKSNNQVIISKSDGTNGYVLGLKNGYIYFKVHQEEETVSISGRTKTPADKWKTVNAGFENNKISLSIDNLPDTSISVSGHVKTGNSPIIIGGNQSEPLDYFSGYIDEISIATVTDYIDVDYILALVVDCSRFTNESQLLASDLWARYTAEFEKQKDNLRIDDWRSWKSLWARFFTVYAEHQLYIDGGFAEGQVNGVKGLNLIAVAGIHDREIAYLGSGSVVVNDSDHNKVIIEMWKI